MFNQDSAKQILNMLGGQESLQVLVRAHSFMMSSQDQSISFRMNASTKTYENLEINYLKIIKKQSNYDVVFGNKSKMSYMEDGHVHVGSEYTELLIKEDVQIGDLKSVFESVTGLELLI